MVELGAIGPPPGHRRCPPRVSSSRAGVDTRRTHPARSVCRPEVAGDVGDDWTVPEELLVQFTLPVAPTLTMTRFGMVWPAVKFRFEAAGRVVPDG